jgi:hypothetical protein
LQTKHQHRIETSEAVCETDYKVSMERKTAKGTDTREELKNESELNNIFDCKQVDLACCCSGDRATPQNYVQVQPTRIRSQR